MPATVKRTAAFRRRRGAAGRGLIPEFRSRPKDGIIHAGSSRLPTGTAAATRAVSDEVRGRARGRQDPRTANERLEWRPGGARADRAARWRGLGAASSRSSWPSGPGRPWFPRHVPRGAVARFSVVAWDEKRRIFVGPEPGRMVRQRNPQRRVGTPQMGAPAVGFAAAVGSAARICTLAESPSERSHAPCRALVTTTRSAMRRSCTSRCLREWTVLPAQARARRPQPRAARGSGR
jgi:hypothetical protein